MDSFQMRSKFDHPLATALTLMFFACLVLVPALLQHEPLKWRVAQAVSQYEKGHRADAIKSLQQVASKLSDDRYVQTTLVKWLAENEQAETAVEYCKQQLERAPESKYWLVLKRESECKAGDFQAAWQTFKQLKLLRTQHLTRSADELNEQAYFRALAEEDLSVAAEEIQRAVAMTAYQSGILNFHVPLPSQALISASLLARQIEAQSIVLPQLNQRIEVAQRALEDRENLLVEVLAKFSKESFPLTSNRESMLDELRLKTEFRRHELGLLVVCRALMFEAMGQPNRCDFDRTQIVELGFQPQMVADLLPDNPLCLSVAMRAIAYLDTRALVLTKLSWNDPSQWGDEIATGQEAITDLDVAVTVSEVIDRVLKASAGSAVQEIAQFRKTFAAVLQHRMMANRKIGRSSLVRSDRERIESLGFDPDGNLY